MIYSRLRCGEPAKRAATAVPWPATLALFCATVDGIPWIFGMQRFPSLPGLCVVTMMWAAGAGAHHSFGNIYDSSRDVTVEGVVAQFQFVHPHPFLIVDAVRRGGDRESWRAEMDNRFELADIGITAETFRPGDRVVMSGSPGRTEPRTLYMWRLERPADGLLYEQVGSTPRINIPRPNGQRANTPAR
jgi:Family of unknown function (DUF6152)